MDKESIRISKINIYKDFQEKGYTTAGMYRHFDDMKKNGISQINIYGQNKEKIEKILKNAERKKHNQTKFGGRNIFCDVYFENDTIPHKVIISNMGIVYNVFGNIKEKRTVITDLTAMTNYKVINQEDLTWLSNFINETKN